MVSAKITVQICPQLKLMVAGAEPSGHLLASDVVAGNKADDPLYVPIIKRVRKIVNRSGLLYVGDTKMSSISTRADIVANKDYYLVPLSSIGENKDKIEFWVNEAIEGRHATEDIYRDEELLGKGYEVSQQVTCTLDDDNEITWQERVLVIRSFDMLNVQSKKLEKRLSKAIEAIKKLTPPEGKGKRQHRTEESLTGAISKILEKHKVDGLLKISWQREEHTSTRYVGRGRGGPNRQQKTETKVRYSITQVERDSQAIEAHTKKLGWRVMATNLPTQVMSLSQCVIHYRGGWCVERDFRQTKDLPLGIRPLHVHRDDQIIGITHLLLIALRILTLIETQVRKKLRDNEQTLSGLIPGQPNRTTDQPTAVRILKTIAKQEITLTQVVMPQQNLWHITPLSDLLLQILSFLGLSACLYKRLTENSS